MAITATFKADFSSFLDAIDKAEIALVDFSKGASKVETTLNRMVDNFSGRKLIQEASLMTIAVEKAGGIAKLTADQLQTVGSKAAEAAEKMQKLGYEVPAGLQRLADAAKEANKSGNDMASWMGKVSGLLGAFGIGVGVTAAVNFAKAVMDDADALMKLHDRTEISVESLQAMRTAGDDAGVTVETMADAVNKLQERLGRGDKGAVAALNELHISLKEFKTLDPGEQFIKIAEALREVKDPLEFARIASDLFGKNWKELAPVIKRGFDDVKDGAGGMSRETIKALDDAGDAATRFWRSVKANLGEALADVLTLSLSKVRELQSEFEKLAERAERNAPKISGGLVPPGLPEDLDQIYKQLDKEHVAIQTLTEDTNSFADAVIVGAQAMEHLHTKTHELAMKQEKELAAERQKNLEARNKQVIEGLTAIQQIEAANADFILKMTLSETDYKIAKINEWKNQTINAFKGTEEQLAAYTTAVTIRAQQQIDALNQVTKSVTTTGDEYSRMYKEATEGVLVIGKSAAEVAAANTAAATQTAHSYSTAFMESAQGFEQFKGIVVAGTGQMIGMTQELMNVMTKQMNTASDYLERDFQIQQAQRARGEFFMLGMSSGMPALSMSGGPTYTSPTVLPNTNLFKNAYGNTTLNNTFNVNGSIKDLARPLMDELTRQMQQTRQWPAS